MEYLHFLLLLANSNTWPGWQDGVEFRTGDADRANP